MIFIVDVIINILVVGLGIFLFLIFNFIVF